MGTKMDKFYFKGEQISKQTLNKNIKWAKILSAIKGGCDTRDELTQRFGLYARDNMSDIKAGGMCITIGRGMHSYYGLTAKGEQLINDVKQYEKEKRNEKI